MNNNRIAIIGAGITGLSAACTLQKSGEDVALFEKNSEPGGAIKTVSDSNWLLEYGPNSLLLKDKSVLNFIRQLGLDEQIVEAGSDADKRYILKNNELVPLPGNPTDAIRTPLFSTKAKIRILAEPFISRSKNSEETVESFVTRRLGREFCDYALNPFIAGIFAGRPDRLSIRHAFPAMYEMEQSYGSLMIGAVAGSKKRKNEGRIKRRLISFEQGLQHLPFTIAKHLNRIHYSEKIIGIEGTGNSWILRSGQNEFGPFNRVIINIPAHKLSEMDWPHKSPALSVFKKIQYPPVSVIVFGFKKEQIAHPLDGFGFLVPEMEKRKILGTLFSSTLFGGRAPDNHVLLTTFVGGMRQPDLAEIQSEKLFDVVLNELADILQISGNPIFREHIFWPKAIPQYEPGYDNIINGFEKLEKEFKGLNFAGNFRGGISVPDCIKNGIALGEKLLDRQ